MRTISPEQYSCPHAMNRACCNPPSQCVQHATRTLLFSTHHFQAVAGSPASLPPRLQRLVPFVQRVMKRYQATPFLAVLHTKCAVKPETLEVIRETKRRLRATSGALPSKSLYRSLISSFSSYRHVTSFVCAICNRVLPPNCWGSRENVAVFRLCTFHASAVSRSFSQ